MTPRYTGHHCYSVSHLWHPFWTNKTSGFNVLKATVSQEIDQPNFVRCFDLVRFILQSITWADFKNLNSFLHHSYFPTLSSVCEFVR